MAAEKLAAIEFVLVIMLLAIKLNINNFNILCLYVDTLSEIRIKTHNFRRLTSRALNFSLNTNLRMYILYIMEKYYNEYLNIS